MAEASRAVGTFTGSPEAAYVSRAGAPPVRLRDIYCRRRVDANTVVVRYFALARVVGVNTFEWDLDLPTGEREERDAKSEGNATHDVTNGE